MKEECYKYGRSGVSTWQLSLPGTGPAVVDAPTRYSSYMNYPWKFRPIVQYTLYSKKVYNMYTLLCQTRTADIVDVVYVNIVT